MAMEYSYHIFAPDRALDPQEVWRVLQPRFAVETFDNAFNARAVQVGVHRCLDEDQEDRQCRYPGVRVRFRDLRNYDEDDPTSIYHVDEMLDMVDYLLGQFDCSADLQFQDLTPYLFRGEGRIVLVDGEFWRHDPARRARITHPHEYREIHDYFGFTLRTNDATLNRHAVQGLLMAKFEFNLAGRELSWVDLVGGGLDVCVDKSRENAKNIRLSFYIKVYQYEAARTRMTAIVRFLLDRYEGDAEFSGLLTRTNNTLTLSDEPDFWTPERKAIMLGKPLP